MNNNALQLSIAERRTLLRLGDILGVMIAALVALRIWALVDGTPFRTDFVIDNAYWIPILVVVWLLLASVNDFYDLRISSDLSRSLNRLGFITGQLLIFYLVVFFLSPRNALPRLFILYYGALLFLSILLWRLVLWLLIFKRIGAKRRVVVVGANWAARTIIQTLKNEAADDYEVIGIIANHDPRDTLTDEVPVLGNGKQLADIVMQNAISEIILAYDTSHLPSDIFEGLMASYEKGIAITPMPFLYEQITGRVPIQHVDRDDWKLILPIESVSIFDPFVPLKRLMDIGVSLVGISIFIAILPFLALAIRLDSAGPIFYTQERLGKGGKPFKIIKLRTMIKDAEKHSGPQWATERDPRVTRVGAFLRKSRLDELPQFINILRGEMSLVGPRAERPYFVEQLAKEIPFYRARLVVRPGATGWAQVRYPYGRTVEDALIKLQYDLYYIRHQSLLLDIVIILRTLGTIVSLSGS
ncbi:MAG: sugar transferase [Phototrophicales bacterium]|nr:MAG: sugar transferase [Phototrophicales bacterium]